LLLRDEEADLAAKDSIAQELIQEEETAKKAAEKKKKKKKKKNQEVEEAEAAGTPGSGGGGVTAYDGFDDDGEADHFMCSLSLDLMVDPVLFGDGFSYERDSIEAWIRKCIKSEINVMGKTKVTSPKTNAEVYAVVFPNYNLKQAIEAWKKEKEKASKEAEAGSKTL